MDRQGGFDNISSPLARLKSYALERDIPIISDGAWLVLKDCIADTQPKSVLEIGTAIGYSAAMIMQEFDGRLVSVEVDAVRHAEAVKNVARIHPHRDCELILGDAAGVLDRLVKGGQRFDLIFMDGPKGQYINYYDSVKKLLSVGGVLFCDNVYFHGWARGSALPPRKNRTMIVNLRRFLDRVTTDNDFVVEVVGGDEAVAVCKKIR